MLECGPVASLYRDWSCLIPKLVRERLVGVRRATAEFPSQRPSRMSLVSLATSTPMAGAGAPISTS